MSAPKHRSAGHAHLCALGLSGSEIGRLLGVPRAAPEAWLTGRRKPRGGARRRLEELFPQVAAADWDLLVVSPKTSKATKAPTKAKPTKPATKSAKPPAAKVGELVAAASSAPDVAEQLLEILEAVRKARRSDLLPNELGRIAVTEAALVERLDRVRESVRAREEKAPVSNAVRERDSLRTALRTVRFLIESFPAAHAFVGAALRGDLDAVRMAEISRYSDGQTACGGEAVDLQGLARTLDGLVLDDDDDGQIEAVAALLVGMRRRHLRERASWRKS